jgi:hypothetical protein
MMVASNLGAYLVSACLNTNFQDPLVGIGFNVLVVMVPIFLMAIIIFINDARDKRSRERTSFELARADALPDIDPETPLSASQWSQVCARQMKLDSERAHRAKVEGAKKMRRDQLDLIDKSEWRD